MTQADDCRLSVLMIGCGNMGAAIAAGAVAQMPDVDITAVDPNLDRAGELLGPQSRVRVVADLAQLGAQSFDVGILAVKPQHITAALRSAQPNLAGALIISIAAGIPIAALRGAATPAARLVRVMPNLPALAAAAMSVGYGEHETLASEDRLTVQRIFGAVGHFCWLANEAEIDIATGVTGSGPGYVFAFAHHLQRAGEALGFSADTAARFARQTIIGAARLLEMDPRSAEELKIAVTSPGGTTAAGLAVLEAPDALPHLLIQTTAAAANRAAQLAKIQQQ
ncbi:MAG: pyrroline-5-carboxylate reductase [Alphaproteobacteria bacterium]|nr:pyrroline-5-carboxylate reductase [Alphaproteobacteria bacterium]